MNKFLLLIFIFVFVSCENPKVLIGDKDIKGTTGLDGDNSGGDSGGGDNGGGGGNIPPVPQLVYFETEARRIEKEDLRKLILPYKTSGFKTLKYGERIKKSRKCHKDYSKKCVVNKQVYFRFNLDKFKRTNYNDYAVRDIQLTGDFYSVGKNHRTELLCILNNLHCSGRGIIKFPKIGLGFLFKMLYWNQSFWGGEYDKVVRTPYFNSYLSAGSVDGGKIFIRKDAPISFKTAFNYNWRQLDNLLSLDNINMVVTDDTFVDKNLKLKIILRRIK